MLWLGVLVGAAGCYAIKWAGLSVPPSVLSRAWVSSTADLIPAALLAALIAVQVFTTETSVVLDARAAGLMAAVVALVLRAPFLVVVVVAALVAALMRLWCG